MSHMVQMVGADGAELRVGRSRPGGAIALMRGFIRHETDRLGNFWVDLVRGTVRILLPLAFIAALVLIALGVVKSLKSGTPRSSTARPQTSRSARSPCQEAIKELGTNGGGFFNANSAHPFENPNSWTNLLEIFLLLVIPVSLTRTFGKLVGNTKQGYVLLSVMGALWGLMLAVIWWAESTACAPWRARKPGSGSRGRRCSPTPPRAPPPARSTRCTTVSVGGWWRGDAEHAVRRDDARGVGTGLYSILVMAIIAMFLAGLMVGRTPEYLGKKLGKREVTAAAVSILAMPTVLLIGAGIALMLPVRSARR